MLIVNFSRFLLCNALLHVHTQLLHFTITHLRPFRNMAFSSLTLNSNYSKYWCGIFPSFPDVLKFFLHHLPMDPLGLLDSIDTSFDIRCHTNIIPEDCSMILSKYSLKILNINIRSMQKNFDNFLVTKSRLHVDYDVIVLGECWLNESSNIRHIQGYVSFHSCNYINKSGGVTIYVRDKWCPTFMELNVEDSNCVRCLINSP